ncbi:MAG: hypothetical protein ACKV0T_24625 [Planctomycetales bacterium]
MHTSGKVLIGFVIVGELFAVWLSANTMLVRSKWMAAAQKNEAEFLKNKEQLVLKTLERDSKRAELARTMLGWDRYWQTADLKGAVQQNGIRLNLGTTAGLQPEQVLYVFALNPDGTSRYVGDFKVTRPSEGATDAVRNWFLYAGDLTPGEFPVRVRSALPTQYLTRLGSLDQQILAVGQTVLTNQAELQRQMELTEKGEALIASRLAEIEGAPALEGQPLPEVNVKGLLAAMVGEEEARNRALEEADQLLRDLKETRERFVDTIRRNRQLQKALPQPTAEEPTVGALSR